MVAFVAIPGVSFQSRVDGVGHNEHSLALVWRAAFSRAKYSPRRFVTKAFQVCNDISESEANVSLDILEETDAGSQNGNSGCNAWPEVSWIVGSEAFTGCAEWLAGITASEDVHTVSKWFPREGFKIRPNRCWVHKSRFHFCNQVRNGEGFDLTKSDCAQSWEDSFKSKFNASASRTKPDVCNCFGSIHIKIEN